ncbi:MAG: hypothetical protein IKN26_00530 [Eubacterium sp.]|nr:hypothetical protein [Eubacterium sp.]
MKNKAQINSARAKRKERKNKRAEKFFSRLRNHKSIIAKLKKKLFAPITNVLDGIDIDYSDRSRTRKALIAMLKLKTPICIFLAIAVAASGCFFVLKSSSSASTDMSLNYEEAAYGLNPNSTRFYVYEIKSPEVVEGMLNYCGIDPESVDMNNLIDCISVSPTNSKAFSEESLFISTTYRITMKKPSDIKGVPIRTLLNFLCKSYKDNLYAKYTENRSILSFDIEKFNDQEYMVIADLFDLKAQQIEKYLNTRVKQNKTFTEKESDETFKSLVQKVDDIRNYDIAKYRSFVKEAGCSHDKARYIRSLGYVNRIDGIDYSKDMAAYTVYNQGIKLYNEAMANIVMIPSIDQEKNTYYMSRTKTGMDYMAKQADDYLLTAQETDKKIKLNEQIIKKMSKGKNHSSDIQKANRMIEDIHKKFAEISKQTEIVDKAYVKYKTKDYLTFKSTSASLMQRLNVTKLFVIALVLLAAIYAAIWLKFRHFAAEVE